jgi:FlaA1/EpsC-like NDP-sugar epimerase
MADEIGVAVSMINAYLDEYEKKKLIKRKKHSSKTVEYFVTKKGTERKKVLNISYLNASLRVYKSAKENVVDFLNQIADMGYAKILLYGAGEVAEILLQAIIIDRNIEVSVLAVVDDDLIKQDKDLIGIPIISLDKISDFGHDGILISSYTNHLIIHNKLLEHNYPKDKIIHFFN